MSSQLTSLTAARNIQEEDGGRAGEEKLITFSSSVQSNP